jgi:hypothetical protein
MLLPDRERRHLLQFHVLPRLTYVPRLAIAGGLVVAGAAVQIALLADAPKPGVLVGAALILGGNLLLLLRGYDLRPRIPRGGGDWERTTFDRFREVRHRDVAVRRWDRAFLDVSCGRGVIALVLLVVAPVAAALFMMDAARVDESVMAAILVDAAVVLLPHWLTGLRRMWRPVDLEERVGALLDAHAALEDFREPPCQVKPMFRMVGEGESRVPVDARMFIRFPDGPEDLLGFQLQVSINDVQGTRYPYLYAVLVARPAFGLIDRHLADVEAVSPGLTVETSREEDAEVIVVRQHTTDKTGYHTNRRKIAIIARTAWRAAAAMATRQKVR